MKGHDVYQLVTDRIMAKLQQGVIPWHRTWELQAPRNLITKRPYRGVNILLLGSQEYASPWWLTYHQAQELGGQVRKGEHGSLIVFWKFLHREVEDEDGQRVERTVPLLRYYTVFNVEQVDGLTNVPQVERPPEFNPIQEAEAIVKGYKDSPPIKHNGREAYYKPKADYVSVPEPHQFENPASYYNVLFHELAHSTGHESRLGRFNSNGTPFSSEPYSREELIAEIGGNFLCGHCEIEGQVLDNSAAYISHWLKKLREDNHFIVKIAGQAQKASAYILGEEIEER